MPSPILPIESARDSIMRAVSDRGCAVVTAPPGSGKSTLVPRFLLDADPGVRGSIVVLQPRRIAARHLAVFSARLLGERVGERVGYQVRFDSRISSATRIIYQTYGVFVRHLLDDPAARSVGTVVIDEFHERSLDIDTVLAWIAHLRLAGAHAPRLIVMSATLEEAPITAFLDDAPHINAGAPIFPVDITSIPSAASEPLQRQAHNALARLIAQGLDGSVLIFMPGQREIRATVETLDPLCRTHHLRLLALHGRLDLDEQMNIVDAAARGDCVIVATNVAETSLTIPGVTAVIDSGWARVAGYDPLRDRNTLYPSPISKHSATQRAGRSGRTAPGRCVRLWDGAFGQRMPEAFPPEVTRLELSQTVFTVAGLLRRSGLPSASSHLLTWLTAPETVRWNAAVERLSDIGAVDIHESSASLTRLGEKLLPWPTDPLCARILVDAQQRGVALLSAAAIALWEDDRGSSDAAVDVFEDALDLALNGPEKRSDPLGRAFDALVSLCDHAVIEDERRSLRSSQTPQDRDRLRREMALCWLGPLHRKIAVREETGARFLFVDGKAAALESSRTGNRKPTTDNLPPALLGLTVRQSAGALQRSRREVILDYLPLDSAWIAEAFPGECAQSTECRWDEKRQAVVGEKRVVFRGLVLTRSIAPGAEVDAEATAGILSERLVAGSIDILDDKIRTFIARVRCVATALPLYDFPVFSPEDWQLVYHEFCHGASSAAELHPERLLACIREYVGAFRCEQLERLAPLRVPLPSGRYGRMTYPETVAPELSARISDLIGASSPFAICEGEVKVTFDILAPNMRTVQKTGNLTSFWTNAYPQIKRELQRRYPRHRWP